MTEVEAGSTGAVNKKPFSWPGWVGMALTLWLFADVVRQYVLGWVTPTEQNFHSLVTLFIGGILVWKSADTIIVRFNPDQDRKTLLLGLVLLGLGILMYSAAIVMEVNFLQQLSLLLALWGLGMLYFGKKPTTYGFLLSLFLIQSVPLLLVTPLTLPLKVLATQMAAGSAAMLGWPVHFTQNLIEVKGAVLQVTSPCSGLHSLVSFTFVWIFLAMTQRIGFKTLMLWMPVVWLMAVLLNALRLFLTVAWGLWIDIQSVFPAHEVLGYVTFGIGLVGLMTLSQKTGGHHGK